jgi:hypothetical protein
MTRKQTEHDTPIYRKARAELLRDQPICHWQDFVATSPNQPELASTGHDQPRLQTIIPDHAGSLAGLVGDMAKQVLAD